MGGDELGLRAEGVEAAAGGSGAGVVGVGKRLRS